MAIAAQATPRLHVGTSVAIAFPRSPAITALSAWTLAKLAWADSRSASAPGEGTYRATLWPQMVAGRPVDARIRQRRAGDLGPLAEWHAAQCHGRALQLNLMVPLLNPGPIEHPDIPIHIAAVVR